MAVVCGVDVSKDTLDAVVLDGQNKSHWQFGNDEVGFEQLRRWAIGKGAESFAMEATGPYHKALLRSLQDAGLKAACLNPLRARQLALGLGVLDKDDKLDALMLAKAVAMSAPAAQVQRTSAHEQALDLSRRIEQVKLSLAKERTRLKEPRRCGNVEESLRRSIAFLCDEIELLEAQWLEFIRADQELFHTYRLMLSVPNIGPKTARVLVSELPARSELGSTRKATGLSGLAPKRRRSGTSLNTADRITKSCNPRVKKALYMPAIQALRRSPDLREFYIRLVSNGKHPKQAIAAVMRKIFVRVLAVLNRGTEWVTT